MACNSTPTQPTVQAGVLHVEVHAFDRRHHIRVVDSQLAAGHCPRHRTHPRGPGPAHLGEGTAGEQRLHVGLWCAGNPIESVRAWYGQNSTNHQLLVIFEISTFDSLLSEGLR